MDWHIITGSKGGIGKTLISLLLLTYYLDQRKDESVLILDLNSANTDTSALLLYNKNQTRSKVIRSGTGNIILKKSYTPYLKDSDQKEREFVVGYPMNPFQLFPHESFAQLLLSLREYSEGTSLAKDLEVKPFQRVIIDTNYHPCNIFPPLDEQYKKYQETSLQKDRFNIWFLWVYRQLNKLLNSERMEDEETERRFREGVARENQVFERTVSAIERIFRKGEIGKGLGPIIHTYAPAGLLPTDISEPTGFLRGLFGLGNNSSRNEGDSVIEALEKLEKLENVGAYMGFSLWLEKLQRANISVASTNRKDATVQNKDNRQLFNDLLYKAVQSLSDDKSLPINVFPLSLYQSGLAGYTDKERADAIGRLAQMNIYKNFRKVLNRKYGESK
jgi:hypothetical protein